MKGHALLWWDGVQEERKKKKQPIKSWDRMVAKLKGKLLPKDYHLSFYRQMKNLIQILITVREYTEDFYKVNIRAGYIEDRSEKVARYMNDLRLETQDELSLLSLNTVEEAYKCSLKVEEKLNRRHNSRKGKGQDYRGKGHQARKNKFLA
jgi:hypothetical protein